MTCLLLPLVLAATGVSRAEPSMAPIGLQTPRDQAGCTSKIRRAKTRFLDTGSICLEGARAHIDGRGCSSIRWKLEDSGVYVFYCESRDTCDITHTGTFIASPAGLPVKSAYAGLDTFCVDNNYTLFYTPGLPLDADVPK